MKCKYKREVERERERGRERDGVRDGRKGARGVRGVNLCDDKGRKIIRVRPHICTGALSKLRVAFRPAPLKQVIVVAALALVCQSTVQAVPISLDGRDLEAEGLETRLDLLFLAHPEGGAQDLDFRAGVRGYAS